MTDHTQIKALDGTVKPVNGNPAFTQGVNSTQLPSRPKSEVTSSSRDSFPPVGATLTGKQEHCKPPYLRHTSPGAGSRQDREADPLLDLKRELLSQQVKFEISELASTTALQRFGAPFRSDYGEVAPVDSEFPILRYIFVHHVRKFPFLDQAREKEFWQDKLQVVRNWKRAYCGLG